jgi:hypothetical protein
MKLNKSTLIYLVVMIVVAAVCRTFGLGAPQIAMALFGGMAIQNKGWAFGLPLISLFISDVIYQLLYVNGLTPISGFYDGQWVNYLIMGSVTLVGLLFRKVNITNILLGTLMAPVYFFIVSNFAVWLGVGVVIYPRTWAGLVHCYSEAIPFFKGSLINTFIFSTIFFGVYYLINKRKPVAQQQAAVAA